MKSKTLVAALALASLTVAGAHADEPAGSIPAGTRLRFHLTAPVSSNSSKTGQLFQFVLIDPIAIDGRTIAAAGAVGFGTVYLAGHAGTSGHEGDLTLRLDSLPTVDSHNVYFADQRFTVNGRNRKAAALALGFVPYAGFGAFFIRGSDIRLDTTTPVETILLRPAIIAYAPPSPTAPASPLATGIVSPSSTFSAEPTEQPSVSPSHSSSPG
jgi:hypothetical protein